MESCYNMIQTELELIDRVVNKTKRFGICWACINKIKCAEQAANDEKEEFASGCVDFKEDKILNLHSIY